jgi:hypothetical protein
VTVIHRVVQNAAVVPECNAISVPGEAAGEFRLHLVREQEVEDRRAFLVGHADDAGGVRHVHEQRLAAGLGVRANDGVFGAVFLLGFLAAAFLDAVFARSAHVGLGAAADALQALQQALHGGRQRVVGGVLAGEQRVAAIRRHFPGQQRRAHGRLWQVGGVRMPNRRHQGRCVEMPVTWSCSRSGATITWLEGVDASFPRAAPARGVRRPA